METYAVRLCLPVLPIRGTGRQAGLVVSTWELNYYYLTGHLLIRGASRPDGRIL